METRVNLMAAATIAGLVLVAATSLLVGWFQGRRLDQFPTWLPAVLGLAGAGFMTFFYISLEDRRAIVFFGTFYGLILLPWIALFAVFGPESWRDSTEEAAPAITDLAGGVLDAVEAKLATYPDGTSVLRVRYADAAAAADRLRAEHGRTPPALIRIAGHEGVLREEVGASSFQFQDGVTVVGITGRNRAAIERRLERSPSATPKPDQKIGTATLLGGLVVYTLFVAWAFLWLSAWAASSPAQADAVPLPASTLRERLLNVAHSAVPFTVRPGDRPDELIAEWRYAEATWLDQMRAHHATQLIRYRLRLEEERRIVRVLEYRAAFETSAGIGGADLNYRVERGITFLEVRRETLLGLQIKDGRVTPEVGYSWHFSVDEMRAPLVRIVTGAGWMWRQVMLDAPWLTG